MVGFVAIVLSGYYRDYENFIIDQAFQNRKKIY